jgi:hypothetical protein
MCRPLPTVAARAGADDEDIRFHVFVFQTISMVSALVKGHP